MSQVLLLTILTLCALGILAAVILYFVAQKFYVYEDPRIDTVESLLPGANCGGCGFAGCRGLADALVKEDDIAPLYCPVGGAGNMQEIAEFLGKVAAAKDPEVAVVRCAGACDKRARNNTYDGASSCAVIASLYGGETACNYGCLGQGDCVDVCNFDAIHVNPATGLAEVDEEKCTACGACVKACPKMIIELRKKGIKGRRVYVSCANKDKGGIARKACTVACIGCGKCVKICPFEAITLENNLAYIDAQKCKLCRKCVPECPTNAIHEVNFPPRKEPAVKPAGAGAAAAGAAKTTGEASSAKPANAAKAAAEDGTSSVADKAADTQTAKSAAVVETEKTANTSEPAKSVTDTAATQASDDVPKNVTESTVAKVAPQSELVTQEVITADAAVKSAVQSAVESVSPAEVPTKPTDTSGVETPSLAETQTAPKAAEETPAESTEVSKTQTAEPDASKAKTANTPAENPAFHSDNSSPTATQKTLAETDQPKDQTLF